jgi:small subunit ribosomal protein S6
LRKYELAYIADPELDEQSLASLEEKIVAWIQAAGGQVDKTDRWGKRRLAYPIKKRTDGTYVILSLQLPPRGGLAIERELRLSEQVLRYMITSLETA